MKEENVFCCLIRYRCFTVSFSSNKSQSMPSESKISIRLLWNFLISKNTSSLNPIEWFPSFVNSCSKNSTHELRQSTIFVSQHNYSFDVFDWKCDLLKFFECATNQQFRRLHPNTGLAIAKTNFWAATLIVSPSVLNVKQTSAKSSLR